MNTLLLINELTSLSIPISGCDSEGNISLLVPYNKVIQIDNGDGTFGSQTLDEPSDEYIRCTTLCELVKAAHGKSLTSEAALALQAELSEAEWLAFVDVRKQPVRQARAARYASECDSLYLKLIEDSVVADTTPDLSTWVAAKNAIRAELVYPT